VDEGCRERGEEYILGQRTMDEKTFKTICL
jgi:hypothetical protein